MRKKQKERRGIECVYAFGDSNVGVRKWVKEKEKKKRGLKNDGEECRLDFVELVGPLEEEEEDKEEGEHQQARDAICLYERGCCRLGSCCEDCAVWSV